MAKNTTNKRNLQGETREEGVMSDKEYQTCNTQTKRSGKRNSKQTPKKKYNRGNSQNGRSRANDVAWYASTEALLEGSASIPYTWPVGNKLPLGAPSGLPFAASNDYIPGMCILDVVTTPGISKDSNSPINIAARNIYSFVRHANSGSSNYDAVDLMQYLLAVDEVHTFHAFCVRTYGMINLYNEQNRYYPKYMIQAMGFDFEDLLANQAQFRYSINNFATRAGSLVLPSGMPVFDRHAWLYSGVYQDGTSAKSQSYAYRPWGYRVYDAFNEGGGRLVWKPLSAKFAEGLKVADIQNIMNEMINPLVGNEDIGIMCGDILKAYGSTNTRKLSMLPETYTVLPVYNEEVLSQFQNATILGVKENNEGMYNITQDSSIGKGNIMFSIDVSYAADALATKRFINLNINEPKPGDTMVATRMMVIARPTGASQYTLDSCGTEIVVSGTIYNLLITSGSDQLISIDVAYSKKFAPTAIDSSYDDQVTDIFDTVSMVSRFKFHPMVNYVVRKSKTGSAIFYQAEIDNYAIIDADTLGRMHETALLSEFFVPQMALVQGYK